MIRLETFTKGDFDNLISWIDSKESLVQFAGPVFKYPLTKNQLNRYIKDKDKIPMKVVLEKNDKAIGHCEINYGLSNPRLSRILIADKKRRGKGIGRMIVDQMIRIIRKEKGDCPIDLMVFSWNKEAINCYEKSGFQIIHENTTTLDYQGLKWERLHMILNTGN